MEAIYHQESNCAAVCQFFHECVCNGHCLYKATLKCFTKYFILVRVTLHLEPRMGVRQEYTLDGMPVHHKAPCIHMLTLRGNSS